MHTEPKQRPVALDRRSIYTVRTVAMVQGAYFLVIGLWPILIIDSFRAMAGTDIEHWLAYTVGAIIAAIGSTLLLAGVNRRLTTELAFLAISSAAALAAIEVIFAVRGAVSWIYLVDVAVEVVLIAGWSAALRQTLRSAQPVRYPHVERLLAGAQSVSLNGGLSRP